MSRNRPSTRRPPPTAIAVAAESARPRNVSWSALTPLRRSAVPTGFRPRSTPALERLSNNPTPVGTVGSAIEGSTPTPLRCSFDPLRRILSEAPVKSFPPAQIRNVALVGHGGAGKTTLTEALLFCAGAIARLGRVEDGTTTTDFDPEEVRRGISLSLALAPVELGGHKINALDVPGYADFV